MRIGARGRDAALAVGQLARHAHAERAAAVGMTPHPRCELEVVHAVAPVGRRAQDVLQGRRVVGRELGRYVGGEAHHEVVGHVRADRRTVEHRLDAERAHAIGGPDARAPEQERVLDHSRGEDHLARVDALAVVELDTGGATVVEHDAANVRVGAHAEVGTLARRLEVGERVRDAHAFDAVHRDRADTGASRARCGRRTRRSRGSCTHRGTRPGAAPTRRGASARRGSGRRRRGSRARRSRGRARSGSSTGAARATATRRARWRSPRARPGARRRRSSPTTRRRRGRGRRRGAARRPTPRRRPSRTATSPGGRGSGARREGRRRDDQARLRATARGDRPAR